MKRTIVVLLMLISTVWSTETPFKRGVNLTGWLQTSGPREIQFTKFTKQDFLNIKSPGGCDYSTGLAFDPESSAWTFTAPNPYDFFGQNISGTQRLQNGNTLICEGPAGKFFEITPEGQIVWEYINPINNYGAMTQGDIPQQNSVFRCIRYSPDFKGFIGKDLMPGEPIEIYKEEDDSTGNQGTGNYVIVDTGQETFWDNTSRISPPQPGEKFYGQDAQFDSPQPAYSDNGDDTVTDLNTGLIWQKGYLKEKLTFDEAIAGADTFYLGGYHDWRVPTIKELYSLIMFSGIDPSGWNGTDESLLTPFIDTNYFDFRYGIVEDGERIIDAQYVSSTKYVSTTMHGNETVFGVNFADGRIKGYPAGQLHNGEYKSYEVKYVRGNSKYGENDFKDNGNIITDHATGLMWAKNDCGKGFNWEEALAIVQQKNDENYLGYHDWRMPNIKELHSILDYARSPATTNSAAIDSIFNVTSITNEGGETDYPYFWSGTTHRNMKYGNNAAYLCFGRALGWMQSPAGNYNLMDVHGAGAQRSDPKIGNPDDYPYGHGPQGDVIRIYNYVRLVRNAETETSESDEKGFEETPTKFFLSQNYPNPFNPTTEISYSIPAKTKVHLMVYNVLGEKVTTLVNDTKNAGVYSVKFDATDLSSGIYFYRLETDKQVTTKQMLVLK